MSPHFPGKNKKGTLNNVHWSGVSGGFFLERPLPGVFWVVVGMWFKLVSFVLRATGRLLWCHLFGASNTF